MENDFLLFSKEPEIMAAINSDIILYSNKIQKMSSFLIKQERNLVIAVSAIYTFQNKKLKKKLKYEDIQGISFSTKSNEFIIHRKNQYDFHYLCHDKIKLICCIIKAYDKYMKIPIILCEIHEKSLKAYVTTKKEKKKDINASRMDKTKVIDTQTFLIDNESNKMLTKSQTVNYNVSKNMNLRINTTDDNNISSIDEENKIKIIFCKEWNTGNINEKDFRYICIIGRGKLSKIYLVENTLNKKFYAVKSINKNNLKEYNKDNIENILKNLNHIFLVNIILCYESNKRIYFFLEYIQNENFFYHIHFLKQNEKINEENIKFYAASILLALEYLHKNGIKYRNLSSRNILINKDGYIKITPFSLEQFFHLKTCYKNEIDKSEYTSPEALKSDEKESSDFWNLGEIIFEMIYGIPPFYSFDNNNLNEIIIKNELIFPKNVDISDDLKNLIEKLLIKNSEERLGYNDDFDSIKNHQFFKDFNFNELMNKKIETPYKPNLEDNMKSKTFEEKYNYEELIKMDYSI